MTELIYTKITQAEIGLTLQQWVKQHYPHITRGLIEKHLRKGFLRVNDKKATLNQTLEKGHVVRIHPVVLDEAQTRAKPETKKPKPYKQSEAVKLQDAVIYKDKDILVINKPAGLAVQGGTGISISLDDMLDSLTFDAKERPKLVHRLDRDTSGVLVLARNTQSATRLTKYFREKEVHKLYWAIVKGVPTATSGKIDVPLQKKIAKDSNKEKVQRDDKGQRALTHYEVLDSAAKQASWLALSPITGRMHQLRVHCLALGTPIVGDGKYGGKEAFLEGVDRLLHLHAYQITLPLANGKNITVTAPPPPHIKRTMELFGFQK